MSQHFLSICILEAENCLKFYFQVSGRLVMSKFSTEAYSLLLTPSLVTKHFGLEVTYTCFVSSKIPPQALGKLTAFPQTPQLGR